MPRGTIVVDAKLLKDHFLRQQRGGNMAGYRGAPFQWGYGIGGIFKSLARYAIPLFKQGAKVVGKRALKAATEVGQDVLQGKNVRESAKTHGREVVKDFAEQGAKALLHQAGRGSKRRQGQRSNLSATKRLKLCSHTAVPRRTKWITEDESNHEDESSHDDESGIATFLKQVTLYIRKRFEEINVF
jgi:hypothetical protein